MAFSKGKIIGAFTILIRYILIDKKKIKTGMCCDLFIDYGYRKDPFLLKRMFDYYKNFNEKIKLDLVIAIPNKKSFDYWEKIVRWKRLGKIKLQILPSNIFMIKNLILFYLSIFNFLSKTKFVKNIRSYSNYLIRDQEFIFNRFRNDYILEDGFSNVFSKIFIENKTKVKFIFGLENIDFKERLFILKKIILKNDCRFLVVGSNHKIPPFFIIPSIFIKNHPSILYYNFKEINLEDNEFLLSLEFFDNR
tara:strand:- start:6841 stop:7587 length:747 start_codon:yes stop_codon:yes gene_type:complete